MRFIESILFKNGSYINLEGHQTRFDQTLKEHMEIEKGYLLEDILPHLKFQGRYKVKVLYEIVDQKEVKFDIAFSRYITREIKTLQLVSTKAFNYSFKYENRDHINELLRQSKTDDVIISINNMITDSSYSNLVFWDGKEWITPDTPLLNGVRRQLLLRQKRIKEAPLRISDLGAFEKVSLINAMLDLEEVEVPFSHILK